MTRTDIINTLIKYYNYKTYLEIGVEQGVNINAINIKSKTGVDPEQNTIQYFSDIKIMTSDKFFKINIDTFDIIFIDGLHHANQVYKDINNALKVLNKGGTIVCHDMLPTDNKMQAVPRTQSVWTGDCWKAWVHIRSENKKLNMYVVNTDFGCGVIQNGKQNLITYKELDYNSFMANKKQWMNIISIDEFNKIYGK